MDVGLSELQPCHLPQEIVLAFVTHLFTLGCSKPKIFGKERHCLNDNRRFSLWALMGVEYGSNSK